MKVPVRPTPRRLALFLKVVDRRFVLRAVVLGTLLGLGGTHGRWVTDAWAGATSTPAPTRIKPVIRFTRADPGLTNKVIRVVEGQTVALCVGADSSHHNADLGLASGRLPAGASFVTSSCNTGGLIARSFTWPTRMGDLALYPDGVFVTFIATDYRYGSPSTASRRIKIVLDDPLQPTLDTLQSRQTLTVGVPFDLPILAADDMVDDDKVTIFTTDVLPGKARLGKTAKVKTGPDTGKWMAHFKWTPTRADYTQAPEHTISFLAMDEDPSQRGVDDPDQSDVTFVLEPPVITDDSITRLVFRSAKWDGESTTLSVAGQVKFNRRYGMISGLGIVLTDPATQQPVTDTPILVQDSGRWSGALSIDPGADAFPCTLAASLVHIQADGSLVNASTAAATKPVHDAPGTGCED